MKFRELLSLNKEQFLPDGKRVYKRIMKRRARPAHIIGIVSSFCLVVAIFVGIYHFASAPSEAPQTPVLIGAMNVIDSVEAVSASKLGVKSNSAFTIRTSEDIGISELSARLSVTPEAKFKLKKTDSCIYELKFSDKLKDDTLYNLQAIYNGKTVYRWAFQTEAIFKVTGAVPDGERHVATDSAVEVTFSHAEVTGFREAFEIVPAVEGTFEHYGRTWAFVPSKPLEPCTLYTVQIKKDVKGPGGVSLEEDYRFSFSTVPEGSYAYLIYQQNETADTFLVNESPIASVCYNQADVSTASVKVYAFEDSNAYVDAYKKYVRNGEISPEISALQEDPFRQFEVTPALSTNYNGIYEQAAFINYPEPLPLGYYFSEIQIGGYKIYQLLQSTTLSLYTVSTNGDYTVWVNDTESGEPLKDKKVSLEGFKDAKTNGVGVANFKEAVEEMDFRVLKVENGNYPYIAVLNGGAADPELKQRNEYYSYITTGSRLYRASDTVDIFGVVLPKKAKAKVPDRVTLKSESLDIEMDVEVSSNGSFTAKLPLNNSAVSYGNIHLYLGESYLTGAHFNIADYNLPVYHIDVTTERLAYAAGDEVRFTAYATYMDGTPAVGIPLSSSAEELYGVTDEDGRLSGSFIAQKHNTEYFGNTNGPEIHSLEFSVDNGTDEFYGASASYLIFDSSYFLKGVYHDGELTVSANQINFDLANQIDRDRIYADGYEEENFKGAPVSMGLSAELHELTYEKKPMGTSYDAINKKVIYTWSYEEKDTVVRNFDFTITDGIAYLTIPERADDSKNYYVLLKSDVGTVQCYLSEYYYMEEYRHAYNISADKVLAKVDEAVELKVRDGRSNETVNSGSVLYTAISGEVVDNFHASSGKYSMKFKQAYVPDVLIYGAYFDGKHIYDLGCQLIDYDLEESRLQIEMEKDLENYQPGDKVTLKFKVKNQEGKPVRAALNLSVLDRALYLITGEPDDPLYELYRSRCFGTTVYTTVSHREFMMNGNQYGEGGGDGEPSRGNFEDTPYFETVVTNGKGEATVSFTLPDTITEWKVVARAVTEDAEAGLDVFDLRSSQGYYVHASMSETIKPTDDFTLAVKGDGLLAPKDQVNRFTVGVTDRDGNEIKTLEGESEKGKYTYLNFGRLKEGLYTVYIKGESGELKDGLIKTVKVENTQSSVWIHDMKKIEQGIALSLKPARGNVTVTITDVDRAFWQEALSKLRGHNGSRADQVLGRYLADEFYATGIWMDRETMDYSLLKGYIDHEGIRLFADREVFDLRFSAKLAAVAPEFCDREVLENTFAMYLNDRYAAKTDVLISYFGLAALGEPVLNDLQLFYMTETDLTPEENAYLALGFAYSGDYTTAQYIFDTRLKALLKESDGVTYASVKESLDEDLTGCCALLSNRLGLEYSEGLIAFIIDTDTEYTLLSLELISYLNNRVMDLRGENKVTVTTGDGRNETYAYPRMGELVLTLSPMQASDLRVINVEGQSSLSYAYSGRVQDLRELGTVSGAIGIEAPEELILGSMSQILLNVHVPENCSLPVMDLILPAGVRFEAGELYCGEWERSIDPTLERNRLQIPLETGDNTISLWIRGALPGNYELEPIVVTNGEDHSFITTDSMMISVVGT